MCCIASGAKLRIASVCIRIPSVSGTLGLEVTNTPGTAKALGSNLNGTNMPGKAKIMGSNLTRAFFLTAFNYFVSKKTRLTFCMLFFQLNCPILVLLIYVCNFHCSCSYSFNCNFTSLKFVFFSLFLFSVKILIRNFMIFVYFLSTFFRFKRNIIFMLPSGSNQMPKTVE